MISLDDVGGIKGVTSTLSTVVPPGVIEDIVKVLHHESSSLKGGQPTEVAPAVFGARSSAANLAHHTRLAREHLTNAVLEAVASLQGTGEAVEDFHKELQIVDADSHAATTALLSRTQQAVDQLDDDRHTPPAGPTNGSKP